MATITTTDSIVLGVDLGTTFTAAAVASQGRVEPIALGTRSISISSTVLVRADGGALVGEAAEARGAVEPERLAREFKRRFGDPVPLVLGGSPYGAERLTTMLLAEVLARCVERLGRTPDTVVVTHPAGFSSYRLELLQSAVEQAGVSAPILLPEPVAAAIEYAAEREVADGESIAVYDFGGGTFDAAVIQRQGDAYRIVGEPVGLDRLGGIDIDTALFELVNERLGRVLENFDSADPGVRQSLARLRGEVRRAKELLSDDVDVVVPIGIAGLPAAVTLTRRDVDHVVEPRLNETVGLLEKSVRSAGLSMDDLSRILLVGGTTRMPIVRSTIARLTQRPITADVDPELAVALGAARSRLPRPPTSPPPPVLPPAHRSPIEGALPFVVPPAAAAPPRISRRGLLVTAAGATTALAAGGVFALTRGGGSSTSPPVTTAASSPIATDVVATTPTPSASSPDSTDSGALPVPADALQIAGYASVRGAVTKQLWIQSGDVGRFVDLGGDVVEADVSPDGLFVAAVLRIGGRRQLVLATMSSGLATTVQLGFAGEAADPAWRPDGQAFAFAGVDGSSSNLYVYDLQGGQVTVLEQSSSTDKYPAWSPDGSKLSFSSDRNDLVQRVFVLTVATGSVSEVSGALVGGRSTWLTNESLVVETDFGGSPELAEIFVDGGEPRRITSSTLDERSPSALVGQRGVLAVIGDPAGSYAALLSADDSSVRGLTEPGTGDSAASVLTEQQLAGLG